MVKFWREGADLGGWDSLPTPNFIKIAQEIRPLGANFYQKIEIFAILSYLTTHFYTYNVEILLKRMDLGVPQPDKISTESLKGFCTWPAGIA